MTVQSIDKRLTPEANMTPAAQAQAQGATSVEDAFVALLQQTARRFANTQAGTPSAGKLLSETVTRTHLEIKADKNQTAADDSQSGRASAAPTGNKDGRVSTKADKQRSSHASAATDRKADAKADNAVASASDDAPVAQAASDDDQSAAVAKDDDRPAARKDDGQTKTPDQVQAAPVAQDQVVIEIDIEETVQVIQVDADAATAAAPTAAPVDVNAPAAANAGKADDAKNANANDALAGLSADDRQRITDLEKKIVDDLDAGDVGDALDAATELVAKLIDKANLHQMGNDRSHGIGQSDAVQSQAQDLSNMLAGSGVTLDIKVQTTAQTAAIDPSTQTAAQVVDAMTLTELAAQGQQSANTGAEQNGQQNTQAQNQGPVVDPAATLTSAEPVQTASVVEETRTFSAILAAQAEASAPVAEEAPQIQAPAALAGVGATQATDKTSQPQAAAQTARAPRVPLQQQVMEQVSVQIDKAVKDGADTVKIQLRPLDLGKIEVKLEVIDGRVSATVTADKPETLALLQKDSKGLEKALEDAGLKPEANSTSFNLRGGENQQAADRGNTNQRSGKGRGRGQGIGPETVGATAAQAAQSNRPGLRSGVDISV
jgi:hypothetical protein